MTYKKFFRFLSKNTKHLVAVKDEETNISQACG